MEEPKYRLIRDALGFYTQVPLEGAPAETLLVEPVIVEPLPEDDSGSELAELGGVQMSTEEPSKRRGRPRRKVSE